jgi:glutathione synthase/RimK-type ligase-like ATP-grasp enzyme
MKTTIAVIIFTPHAKENEQLFLREALRDAYTAFSRVAAAEGVSLYRASTRWYDPVHHQFRQAWHWDGDSWTLAQDIIPDVIYDKAATTPETLATKMALAAQFPMVNDPAFTAHAGSKFFVSQAFKDFLKPYFSVTSPTELQTCLQQIPGARVVAKPDRGNSGEGVLILDRADLLRAIPAFPFLIQEFIDSSAGIPGVMKGLHDLRLIFSNTELVYAYYRTPKSGSYLANVARGGTQTMLATEQIPASVWPIVDAVQKYYADFAAKIYTIDLMFDRKGTPWIVELNTMPGLYPDESERPHIGKLYQAIARALNTAARKK